MPNGLEGVHWGSFGPGFTPVVPASQTQTSSGASDPIAAMMEQMGPAITEKDIQAAATPIAGPHAAQLPSNMTTPITPHQDTPLDYRPVVGAGNARARGIGNSITAVMNGLGKVVTAEAQHKQNQIRDSATKVITAQQAIDEAQQQLDMAMQSGDTATVAKMKDIIQQNTAARDGVFADPKMRKALAKGFNINYVDPQQNKTTEHAAVQEAIKGAKTRQEKIAAIQALRQKQNAEAATAAGKAYAAAQPQGLAPNTQAQMQLQMKLEQQKVQQQAIKDFMNYRAAMAGHAATITAAQLREQGALIMKQATFQHQQDMLDQRYAQAKKLLGSRISNEFALIAAREQAARVLANEVYTDKETDPLTMYSKSNAALLKYQDNLTKNQNTLTSLIQERQKDYPEGAGKGIFFKSKSEKDPLGYQALNVQIALTQKQIQNNQSMIANLQKSAQAIKAAAGLSGEPVYGGTSNSGSTDDNSLGSTDFSDPSIYLNPGPGEEDNQ